MNSDKPYLICNMMISLDGKISYGTIDEKEVDYPIFWDYMDLYEEVEKSYGDDWSYMIGRKTMDEVDIVDDLPLDEFKSIEFNQSEDFIAQTEYKHFGVYTDLKGKLRWKDNFRKIHNIYGLIAIVNSQTPKEYLAYLRSKNISYIFGGDIEISFKQVLSKLKSLFGVEKLLLEGGGFINGAVIQEDLIDEISLMILPFVVNNKEAPELFYSKPTLPKSHSFKLEDVIHLNKGVVRLRYLKDAK